MLRSASALLLGLLVAAIPSRAQDLPRPGCDPISFPSAEPVPPGEELACGDGRVEEYTRSCARLCAGGCPGVGGCGPVQCVRARELGDGANLDGQSCRSRGFAGGTLACRPDCHSFDVDRCEACFAGAGVRCATTELAAVVTDVHASASGEGVLLAWHEADALVVAALDDQRFADRPTRFAGERFVELLPVDGGWLLATASGSEARVRRVTRAAIGPPRVVAAGSVSLWPLDDGSVVITTSTDSVRRS